MLEQLFKITPLVVYRADLGVRFTTEKLEAKERLC